MPSRRRQTPLRTAGSAGEAPALRTVGTMSELMVHLIRPASDAVFYITSRAPQTGEAWETLTAQTLTLTEAGTLLMLPTHARGRAQWLADARLMREAGRKAFEAAKKKDLPALSKLRFERLDEGKSVQTMHVGSYDEEGPTLERLHREFLPQNGLVETGHHHEIYLGDPRKTAPEKLKTILRQPVKAK